MKRVNSLLSLSERSELWCTCFSTKTEVLFFLISLFVLWIEIFGREFSLSTLTLKIFYFYSFIRFFIHTLLLLLLLLLFTRRTVGRRLSCIVNDRGLRCLDEKKIFLYVFIKAWKKSERTLTFPKTMKTCVENLKIV